MEIAAQLKLLLEGLSGVRDAILYSADGRPLQSIGIATSVAEAAVLTASIANELSRVGELLTLSPSEKAAARRAEPPRARPAPTASREPVFAGQLDQFCLPDLLEFLRAGQRTGLLRLEGRTGKGLVRMRRGKITNAASPDVGTTGDYLIRHGVVNGEQLRRLLQEQRSDAPKKSVGRLAIERQLATAADVRKALVTQLLDAVRELKDWTTGTFAFEPETASEPNLSEIEVELDPQAVLLTIFKEEDEAHVQHASGADAAW